jgi:hypothetical protein
MPTANFLTGLDGPSLDVFVNIRLGFDRSLEGEERAGQWRERDGNNARLSDLTSSLSRGGG